VDPVAFGRRDEPPRGARRRRQLGVKVTVLTVVQPFHTVTTDTQMIEDTPARYEARMRERAEQILGGVAQAAQAAGVA
jgi:hypothetical protein